MVTQLISLSDAQKKLFSSMRSTMYDIVTYLDSDTCIDYLKSIGCCNYALIEHNLDYRADGSKIKNHIHIVAVFSSVRRGTNLARLFNTTELRVIPSRKMLRASFMYLTHETEKAILQGKVKYEKSKLISNGLDYFNNLPVDVDSLDDSIDIIDGLISNVPLRQLVSKYGKNFVYHYSNYRMLANEIYNEELKNNKKFVLTNVETGEIYNEELKNNKKFVLTNVETGDII